MQTLAVALTPLPLSWLEMVLEQAKALGESWT